MNSWKIRYTLSILQEWLTNRPTLHKTIGNTGWLLFDRVLRMVIGITVGTWVAKYLGPSQFGELSYVISFIAFFQVIADLQADGIIVRDIAQERGNVAVILGTTLWLRIILGIIAWLCATLLAFLLHPSDTQLILLTFIVGGSMIFQSAETIDIWFQSQSKSKMTVLAKSVAYLFSNSIKIILLLTEAPLSAFAAVICLECAAFSLSLVTAYRRHPTSVQWTAHMSQAKKILAQCWPFTLSGVMITAYIRIDQIMLKEILGERELGLFAAALTISNVWTVIPTTLVTSLAPFVARTMHQDIQLYKDLLVKIFRLFAGIALLGALLTSALSPWIIRLLFGPQFHGAAAILTIYVFVNIFIFQGIAQTLWVINNNVRSVTLVGTTAAAILGIISNAILIRTCGVMGAVYSIMLTQGTAVVILPCLLRQDLRQLYRRAFFPLKANNQL